MSVERAADAALSRNRDRPVSDRRGNMALDITWAAEQYGVDISAVARMLGRRNRRSARPRPRIPRGATERCREGGANLRRDQSECPQCGAGTSGIAWEGRKYNDMTMESIVRQIKKLCSEGLTVSERIGLRKAVKSLSSDMTKNPSSYSKALDKGLIIEIKKR
jgi:hypothetical protein